jgi:hypothetical protein
MTNNFSGNVNDQRMRNETNMKITNHVLHERVKHEKNKEKRWARKERKIDKRNVAK